jgi:2-polyprenyl-6-methoxyphenol hydroxylase-like FAD-dependent oxidoreductase
MASIVVAGGGIVAMLTAVALGGDGHQVTVLERDPSPAPGALESWDTWKRRGIGQFRLPHLFPARFRAEVERELPQVAKALDEAGAARINPIARMPSQLTGGWQADDREHEILTGRRPVMEAAIAAVAQETAGVTVRRGVGVTHLIAGSPAGRPDHSGPRITGVRTTSGEQITAGLVVDATGRRSVLPDWLAACGAARPVREIEDTGFVYYSRHFRSPDGSLPPFILPSRQDHGSITSLLLPADNGTWSVVIAASAADDALQALRDPGRWSAVVRSLPLPPGCIDGEPLEDRVITLSKIKDQYLRLTAGGRPVATGVVAVGDAWACTSPSLGRGVSMGTLHGLALRDVLRRSDPADPARFAADFEAATRAVVQPWHRATLWSDRHRLAEMNAAMCGDGYRPADPQWEAIRSVERSAPADPGCLRAVLSLAGMLRTPEQVLSQPGLAERAAAAGPPHSDGTAPARSELLVLVAG